jgi:hypothetical protein
MTCFLHNQKPIYVFVCHNENKLSKIMANAWGYQLEPFLLLWYANKACGSSWLLVNYFSMT